MTGGQLLTRDVKRVSLHKAVHIVCSYETERSRSPPDGLLNTLIIKVREVTKA